MRSRTDNNINGIDFLEVVDQNAASDDLRQRQLRVHLVKPHSGNALGVDNVRVEGGERIKNIDVVDVRIVAGDPANVITVEVDRYGDFSTYTLRLLRSDLNEDTQPPEDFDPILATIEFSFKVECPSDFDCESERICPPDVKPKPQIDYLAKDYASFRRLMLDRMAVLVPEWEERHAADLGVALVELLAYVGDHLSYEQDAIATEAYLGTARRRISVRRHARLVDYFISDGSNARTWVQIRATGQVVVPAATPLVTRISGHGVLVSDTDLDMLPKSQVIFETMHDIELFPAHNTMRFYTWSDTHCCLPAGATKATLAGHFPNLQTRDENNDEINAIEGDILVFEEILGPDTGNAADADPQRRHPVLLTSVRTFVRTSVDDPEPLTDPVTDTRITEIEWASEDALPFAFCISSTAGQNVSVARGNIVRADHGRTINEEEWNSVLDSQRAYAQSSIVDRCNELNPKQIPIRFNPRLKEGPVTQAGPSPVLLKSARAAMQWTQHQVLPAIKLISDQAGENEWEPKRDLLNSEEDKLHFVAEVESDGAVFLRFGNDDRGKRPNAGTRFTPQYRIGNGVIGNIGVDSLAHILSDIDGIIEVRNLTPGQGGAEAESIEDVRQRAPYAFRTQERAVTQKDYEEVTQRHADVQRVAAIPRWTGSWYTWFLTVDRKGGLDVDQDFENEIRNHVERFRMAGYDLEVDGPLFAPLEIEMFVCVKPDFFRSDVKAALLSIFNNQRLPDGRLGVFHPDNFTFGQTVYLSPLYAKAQAVAGVSSVYFKTFQRQRISDPKPLETGELKIDRLEIAQLDNDRNFPERGVFHLEMGGGK